MEFDFEERINSTLSANNIPVPVTVLVSEDRVANTRQGDLGQPLERYTCFRTQISSL